MKEEIYKLKVKEKQPPKQMRRKHGRPTTIQLNPDGRYVKWCSICETSHPLSDFYFNKKTGYYSGYCRRHAGFNSKMYLMSKGVFERRAYQVVSRAKNKGLQHECVNDLKNLLESCWRAQGGKCYLTDVPLKVEASWKDDPLYAWHVDRINPNLGYVEGNIAISSAALNFVKQRMSLNDFITLCEKILNLHRKRSREVESS